MKTKYITITMILACLVPYCKDKEPKYNLNPLYKDDINIPRQTNYHFDINNLPKEKVTKEEELKLLYPDPMGATQVFTFKQGLVKNINEKTVQFDRVYFYTEMKSISSKTDYSENQIVTESFDLAVLVNKGLVEFNLIDHYLLNNKNEWTHGKYHNNDPKITNPTYIWDGHKEDFKQYWRDRGDWEEVNKKIHNNDY